MGRRRPGRSSDSSSVVSSSMMRGFAVDEPGREEVVEGVGLCVVFGGGGGGGWL